MAMQAICGIFGDETEKCDYKQLQAENEALREQSRCPCGGELVKESQSVRDDTVLYDCNECGSQLILVGDTYRDIM